MSLDPELLALLDPAPAIEKAPIEAARAAQREETARLAGTGPEVDHVRDDTVDGVPVRVYEPSEHAGTLVYFHGGGWALGDLDSVDALCRRLANESRTRVVSADYRLAPEHPFPAGFEDALTVARGADADVVAGDSAGANLAAGAARHLRDRIRLQLLVYPVTDAGGDRSAEPYGLSAADMQRFWRLYGADPTHPDASPMRADDLAGAPPAYVITASHDVLRAEGEAYAAALERAGVPVTLTCVEGTIHGFWRYQSLEIARRTVREAALAVRAAIG
ncbi:MAG TPA: alpha/beta hydrolase [Solirubrobacter sp.]|nr:alpha/beta hydrolase [Solirubrobacter sp.]